MVVELFLSKNHINLSYLTHIIYISWLHSMTKLYELVVLLHPQLSSDEKDAINKKLDTLLGAGKKQTDDMGLVQLAHPVAKARLTQVYMISFYCELTASQLTTIKHELSITKGVIRNVFFSMTAKDAFYTYADANKKFEQTPEAVDGKKPQPLVRKGYFNKEAHNDELSWKSTKLLTFYMTRFGDIKPRKFMGNSVSQQKKLRQAILRARELGMLAYTH